MGEFSVAKEQQSENRMCLADKIPLNTPLSMQLELASACNFRCKFCMHHDDINVKNGKLKLGVMQMDTFERAVKGISEFSQKLKMITLQSRGESLLNPQIVEMTKFLKKANVTEKIGLYTNGVLLTRNIADGLIDAGLDVLHISIEGVNAAQYYDVTRTYVDFEELVNNIKYFYEHKTNTYLYVKIIDCGLSDKDKKIFKDTFKSISDNLFIEAPVDAWQGAGVDKIKLKENRYNEKISKVDICPRIFFAMVVHYDGTVVACDHDWSEEEPVGNINEESISDIWVGKNMERIRQIHLKGQADLVNRCKTCIQRRECLEKDNIDILLNK